MDATPSPEYTYILVILLGVTFVLGLAAGYLSKTRQPTLPEDLKQQFYSDGYLAGFNAGGGDAFKKGYGSGYNQAVIDSRETRTPQPQPQPQPEPEPEPIIIGEPDQFDDQPEQAQERTDYEGSAHETEKIVR